jgi:transposase Tn5 family protein
MSDRRQPAQTSKPNSCIIWIAWSNSDAAFSNERILLTVSDDAGRKRGAEALDFAHRMKTECKIGNSERFLRCLARLGGFVGRKSDGEPRWQTIWMGYRRFQNMLEGADLVGTCG